VGRFLSAFEATFDDLCCSMIWSGMLLTGMLLTEFFKLYNSLGDDKMMTNISGIIKWDTLWGIKQCELTVILVDFPYNCALFWLVRY